jgi:hypothetical protein
MTLVYNASIVGSTRQGTHCSHMQELGTAAGCPSARHQEWQRVLLARIGESRKAGKFAKGCPRPPRRCTFSHGTITDCAPGRLGWPRAHARSRRVLWPEPVFCSGQGAFLCLWEAGSQKLALDGHCQIGGACLGRQSCTLDCSKGFHDALPFALALCGGLCYSSYIPHVVVQRQPTTMTSSYLGAWNAFAAQLLHNSHTRERTLAAPCLSCGRPAARIPLSRGVRRRLQHGVLRHAGVLHDIHGVPQWHSVCQPARVG